MPEQVDMKNSRVHNKKRELSFIENIELQLKAGDTIENLEKTTQQHIEDAEKELQRLKDGKAASDIIFVATKKLNKWIAYGKAVKSYKATITIEAEIQEQAKKTKKCYEETTKMGEEIIEYITQFDMDDLGDIPAKKKFLDEKIGKFEKHLQIQLDLNKRTISLLNELRELKPNYDVYEQYRGLIPSYEGKTVDYVKAKYKETVIKIKALEEKKAKADFLNDRKKFDELIKSLKDTVEKVLPYMLSNPRKMEQIKQEVAKELGTEYKPKTDPIEPGFTGGTPTGDTGNQTGDDKGPKKGDNNGNTGTPTGDTGYVPPVTGKDSPKFKDAKAEYINIVESINKLIDKLNDFNANQSMYAFNPELNYDKMIATEQEVIKVNVQINRYKDMLTELEYKKYVDEHIMLNLDPEMKDIKPKELVYNSDLEEFMELHNNVIRGCYARLHEIAAIPNYTENAELVAESKKLLEIIDVQHMVIQRRLITERHNNKDFDLIGFMKAHRVDPKQVQKGKTDVPAPVVQPGGEKPAVKKDDEEPVVKPGGEKPKPKNEEATVKEIQKQIAELQQNFLTLYIARYLLRLKLAPIAEIDAERVAIEHRIDELEKIVRLAIDQSGLSDENRMALHDRVDGAKMQASTEVDHQFQAFANVHNLREEFVKEVRSLMLYSEQLIKLSETSIESEEYKKTLEAYYQKIDVLKVKFAKYDVKFSVDSVTSKTKITIGEKSGINMTVMSKEQKATAEVVTLSVMTLEKEKEMSKQKTARITKTKLNFGGKVQDVDRRNAIIGTMNKVRITLLKNSIRVQYTKQMIEELKGLKVRLEVAAAAENKNDIQVTKAVDTKDGQKEYRHIKNPTKLTEAKLIYRDTETNEEIVSYDILQNEEIQEVLEERRKMSR